MTSVASPIVWVIGDSSYIYHGPATRHVSHTKILEASTRHLFICGIFHIYMSGIEKVRSSPTFNRTNPNERTPTSTASIKATMIRQTPRLVNLASRSAVARNAAGAPSKQQLALRSFASSEDAKRTVSSPEVIDPLEVFAAIDTNNDGVLQKDEFLRAVDMLNYDEVRVHFSVTYTCMQLYPGVGLPALGTLQLIN